MHKTIYIDADEEITSVIDKIRKEGAPDIFLVVPQEAVLFQGVINLKLLKKETEKLRKSIVLITSDKHAKKIIEDLGMDVQDRVIEEPTVEETEVVEKFIEDRDLADRASDEVMEEIETPSPSREIGSNSFFEELPAPAPEQPRMPKERPLKIKVEKELISRKNPSRLKPKHLESMRRINERMMGRQTEEKRVPIQHKKNEIREPIRMSQGNEEENFFRKREAEQFFARKEREQIDNEMKRRQEPDDGSAARKLKKILIMLIVSLALAGSIAWAYINLPKIDVVVYSRDKEISAEVELKIIADGSLQQTSTQLESDQIFGELKEMEIVKTKSFNATGEKFSSDKGNARGKVKIYNKYSSSAQPLVKTTRVLSKEGKLFRLAESVTVPGMKDGEPGEIEVNVVADQPGSEYNIEPSSFTIEGFKSGPKYEKFEVISEKNMTGGEDSVENKKVKYVTAQDIEKARAETIDELEKNFEQELSDQAGPGKKILADSVRKEITDSSASYKKEEITDKFDFTIKEKVTAVVFYEEDIRNIAQGLLLSEVESGYQLESSSIAIQYLKDSVDFEKKTMNIEAKVTAKVWPKIDVENIKKGIAFKKENEIKDFLMGYPELKKSEIQYHPVWLTFIPISEKKIKVEEKR